MTKYLRLYEGRAKDIESMLELASVQIKRNEIDKATSTYITIADTLERDNELKKNYQDKVHDLSKQIIRPLFDI